MNWLKTCATKCFPQGDYLYHITTMDNAYDIASSSLDPHSPEFGNDDNWAEQYEWPDGGTENRTYFGWGEDLDMFAKDHRPVYLRVSVQSLQQLGIKFLSDGCDMFVRKSIPAEVVEIKLNGNWVPVRSIVG